MWWRATDVTELGSTCSRFRQVPRPTITQALLLNGARPLCALSPVSNPISNLSKLSYSSKGWDLPLTKITERHRAPIMSLVVYVRRRGWGRKRVRM